MHPTPSQSTKTSIQGLLLGVGIDPDTVNKKLFREITTELSNLRPQVTTAEYETILTEHPALSPKWSALKMSAKIA